MVTVRAGKGRKTRQIPIPSVAAELLGEWLEDHPGGQLLRSVDGWGNIGGGLASDSVAYVLERMCDTAGTERVSPHAFRAHRISEFLSHADPLLAQRCSGHSSVSTTAIYDRRGDKVLADIVDHIANTHSGRESDQSSVHANTVWTPSAIRNTSTCPNEVPIVLAS